MGAESNGSGVSMLLELARVFSVLYSMPKSRPKHNLVFLLTGAGKLNYQGSKKWLEDQFDGLEGSVIQVFILSTSFLISQINLFSFSLLTILSYIF